MVVRSRLAVAWDRTVGRRAIRGFMLAPFGEDLAGKQICRHTGEVEFRGEEKTPPSIPVGLAEYLIWERKF